MRLTREGGFGERYSSGKRKNILPFKGGWGRSTKERKVVKSRGWGYSSLLITGAWGEHFAGGRRGGPIPFPHGRGAKRCLLGKERKHKWISTSRWGLRPFM